MSTVGIVAKIIQHTEKMPQYDEVEDLSAYLERQEVWQSKLRDLVSDLSINVTTMVDLLK